MTLAAVLERSRRDKESWRYTPLDALLKKAPAAPRPSDLQTGTDTTGGLPLPSVVDEVSLRHQIVFVNGAWRPGLSRLGTLPEGIIRCGADNSYTLALQAQTCLVTTPIELVFAADGAAEDIATRLEIEVGPNARLTLVEHHLGGEAARIAHAHDLAIRLGEQSKLVHGKILHGQPGMAHLARADVRVAEGAYYRNFALLRGTWLSRNEIHVALEGELAQCALNGVMLLRGSEHADTFTRIQHRAPHGTSRQFYKSVVGGRAKAAFQGKIIVAEGAQKADAQQMSRALLLSAQAEMNAKPELEIYADDVSCSHGSAVGDLDPDALFYLCSRGLNATQAKALLLRGFVEEVIDENHIGEWSGYVRAETERWLNEDARTGAGKDTR